MRIELDDLSRPAIHQLLEEHLANMYELSPPESVHALDLSKLKRPEIAFWTIWEGDTLMGCGALKDMGNGEGEIKSMRTPKALRGRGAGRAMLKHILAQARARGMQQLWLETGSQDAFEPARQLYASEGFTFCGPFADYTDDPNSMFMTLSLAAR